MNRVRTLLFACLVGTLAACSDDPIATDPTPTEPTTFTEVFAGTLNRNGAVTHTFVSQTAGSAIATISSLLPDAAQVVGLSLGTWTGSACQIIIANDQATQFSSVRGDVGSAGNLCVRVYDVGRVAGNSVVTYEVTLQHP